jgi:glucose-1-phosphate thymidylyltransferase
MQETEVVGVIPAAGHARRLGPLPCSKEILPLMGEGVGNRQCVLAADHALAAMRRAGIERAFVLVRSGKWDIPAALADGSDYEIQLAYRVIGATPGMAHTLDTAYPFIKHHRVALAFPDTLLRPQTVLADVRARQEDTGADLVLGAFPAPGDQSADLVDVRDGVVHAVQVKPEHSALHLAWVVALWTPVFTRFLHAFIGEYEAAEGEQGRAGELHLGAVIQAAIDEGLRAEAVAVPEATFLDIGTPDKLRRAMQGPWAASQ